ncbi:MAG: hypothetical protein JWO57_1639 [Pseudonocardiales bacterium]|nr:hypothetical protein [Pseudonocardiales bacterium]
MTAVDELLALSRRTDPISAADDIDLPELQLAAARERFAELRPRIRLLDQRASDMGVDGIEKLDDLVPVLFAHTAYKSYPASFVDKGQWERLTLWFSTVSSTSMDGVDLDGVVDVDDWIARLEAAGHGVFSSSGTSGKASFIDQTQGDIDRIADLLTRLWGWPSPPPRDNSRPLFSLTPSAGPARLVYAYQAQAKYTGRPGAIYTLTDEPIRMGELNRIMRLQQALASGKATPAEVAQFEAGIAGRAEDMRESYRRIALALDAHRHEPIVFHGSWPQVWALLEVCRDVGIAEGGFHPESIYLGSGGTKGMNLPDDYQEQVARFFGGARRYRGYGMSETSTHSPVCEHGRYHVPPWLTLFVLDETGEAVRYAPTGPVTGRAAYWDPVWDGHWGATISGDWITADYGRCPCGRPGPSVEDSVRRAKDVIGIEDDKISCAGAIEAYVRGAITTAVDRP